MLHGWTCSSAWICSFVYLHSSFCDFTFWDVLFFIFSFITGGQQDGLCPSIMAVYPHNSLHVFVVMLCFSWAKKLSVCLSFSCHSTARALCRGRLHNSSLLVLMVCVWTTLWRLKWTDTKRGGVSAKIFFTPIFCASQSIDVVLRNLTRLPITVRRWILRISLNHPSKGPEKESLSRCVLYWWLF